MVISSSSGEKIIYPNHRIEPIHSLKRFKDAGITFLKWTCLTLLFALIPILHFVLVPIGVMLTAGFTIQSFKKTYDLENFEVHCPNCDQKSHVRVMGTALPLRTFCSHCRHMVYLSN